MTTEKRAHEDAVESALRSLERRDRTIRDVERRLAERGFGPEAREHAVESLTRTGLLDDVRYATRRAEALAERGAGDALIRDDLIEAGVESGVAEQAIGALEPEVERAARIVAARGSSARTARYLCGRGYSGDVLAAVVATEEAGELP